MFPYILIFWYPCRDWLAGNSQAFPGPDATIRAIPDKNYSSIYLHTLASICKKSFNTFVAGFWPLGHLGKQQQYEGENLVKHDDPTSIFPWQRKYFPLYFLKFYSTVVLFIVPLSAKLSALPVLVLALVLVLVHVLILVLVLWLIPMQSSHLPSARAHLDRRS